jgi:hypothetical protein
MKYYVSDWMELLLKKIAENNIGPTHTSRWLFIASNCIYNSYQSIIYNKSPIDNTYWTWKNKPVLISNTDMQTYWVDACCYYIIPKLITVYMNKTLLNSELPVHNRYKFETSKLYTFLQQTYSRLDSYLLNRDNDGWKNTSSINTNNPIPNINNFISADNSVEQDLSNILDKYTWTPLKFNNQTVKPYLTPEWGDLTHVVNCNDLINTVSGFYPSESQMDKEITEVVNISSNLTDKYKIIAEFWAGGPGTVTPPGMWIVFANIYLRSNNKNLYDEIKFYTLLSHCVFQSSICAWKLKRNFIQARPIQLIRINNANQNINNWNGIDIGSKWLPYQESNFVTPPFPDFVSGHSTFSSSCAKMLLYLTGSNNIVLQNPVCNINILSLLTTPNLLKNIDFCLNQVFILPKSSNIDSNTPSTIITLNWNTWNEMAISSGDSRIYGGIHIESSNKAGIYLGDSIADKIWKNYKYI